MAESRKEHEVLFALNAKYNGNGALSKAQQEFTQLGKEIQSLSRIQSDVSSYQKQQAAVESTSGKLANLGKQQQALQAELDATRRALEASKNATDQDAARTAELEKETASLERESAKLEQRITNTAVALERHRQKATETGERLRAAGVDTSNLTEESARLENELRDLKNQQDDVAKSSQDMGEKGASAFEAVGEAIAAAGIAAALKEIGDAYIECVKVSAEFESAMSDVEALSGATAAEMEALTATAKEMGATTKFTAKESADAMGYMAMAGWDAEQMMDGMSGVINLAAASGEDLAEVSDIVTDNLTAFGLAASDTGRFADVLAAAATSANTNVGLMGETFKYAAPVAGALGFSVEDVAVAVGLMANAGIKGSQAGTALRSVMSRMSKPTDEVSTAMEALGVSLTDGSGQMLSFADIMEDLRDGFSGLTEAQKAEMAAALGGQEAMSGLLAIVNASDADFANLTASINESAGAAERMAEIRLDNLQGDLTLLDSAWSALKTTIGEEFNPELRAATELATEVITKLDEFAQEHPALVKGVMAFTGAIGLATGGMMALNAATKLFSALNVAALFSGPTGLIIGGVAAVAGLTAAVVGLTTAANESLPSVKDLTEAAREMEDVMGEAGDTYGQTAEDVQAAASVADTYITKLEEMGEYTALSTEEQEQYLNTLSLLCNAVPELAGYVDMETGAIEGGTAALRAHTEAWVKDAQEQAKQDYLNELYSQYNGVMKEAAANSIKLTEAQIRMENLEKDRAAALERMNELNSKTVALTAEEQTEYYQLEDALLRYNSEVFDAQDAIDTYTEAVDADNEALAAAQAEFDAAAEAVDRLTGAEDTQAQAQAELASQTEALGGVISSAAEEVRLLTEAYGEAYHAAYESVSGQYDLWDEAAEVAATSAGDINSALESQAAYWQDYNANLASLADRANDIDGLREVIASFADGSAESVNAIAGMAAANDEDLTAMVKNWQDVQAEWDTTADSLAKLQTDFDTQMGEIVKGVEEDINSMNFSDEAAQAARETILSYIGEAEDQLPEVERAYGDLARAARRALSPDLPSRTTGPTAMVQAYASGTEDAAPGVALVGEEGPELVYFDGGEQVISAERTARILQEAASRDVPPALLAMSDTARSSGNTSAAASSAAAPTAMVQAYALTAALPVPETAAAETAAPSSAPPVSIQLAVHVDGDASTETVEQLRSAGDEIAERIREVVEDVLDQREEERVRRRY